MANIKTLGVALTMALGAAGLTGCAWYEQDRRAAEARQKQEEMNAKQQAETKAKKQEVKESIMPPLTQVDGLDTLVFKSYNDSVEYNKYSGMAYGNYSKISNQSEALKDSVINAKKKELEPKIQELETKSSAEDVKLREKRDKAIEQAEKDYQNNKITFEQLEAKKQKIENQFSNEWGKVVYPIVQKKDKLEEQIRQVEERENAKQEKTDKEAHEKFLADQKVMRDKYTKEVRKYGHPGPLEQDLFGWARVQYKSKDDSIKANEYVEKQSKIYAPYEKKEFEIQKKMEQLEAQIEKLQNQGKYEQADKLWAQYDKLSEQYEKASDNSMEHRIVPDSIAKYTKKHPFKLDTDSTKYRYFLNTNEVSEK